MDRRAAYSQAPPHVPRRLVGEGHIYGTSVASTERTEMLEIPTTHRIIQYMTDTLGTGTALDLQARWSGLARIILNPNGTKRFATDPEPGESVEHQIHDSGPINYQISRSDWYSKVLSPIRQKDYVYFEVAVPRGNAASAWRNSLALLARAEEAYAKRRRRLSLPPPPGHHRHPPRRQETHLRRPPRTQAHQNRRPPPTYGDYLHALARRSHRTARRHLPRPPPRHSLRHRRLQTLPLLRLPHPRRRPDY